MFSTSPFVRPPVVCEHDNPSKYSPPGGHPLEKIGKLTLTRTPDPNRPKRRGSDPK